VDKADKERPEFAIELTLIEDSYGDRRTVDGVGKITPGDIKQVLGRAVRGGMRFTVKFRKEV
jgi:hypothetical protein